MKTALIAVWTVILGFFLAVSADAAGNVTATLSSKGQLKINGTGDDNQIRVTNDGVGNILVVGMPSTGTTINGLAQWVFEETNHNTL